MPIYKAKNTHRQTKCFITMHQDMETPMEYVRASGNNVSVIDEDGRSNHHLMQSLKSTTPTLKFCLTTCRMNSYAKGLLSKGWRS